MQERFPSFLKNKASNRAMHDLMLLILSSALEASATRLHQAAKIAENPDAEAKDITTLLFCVVSIMSRTYVDAIPSEIFHPSSGTISAQLLDENIAKPHRKFIYEIAIVVAEDIRTDVLRLIHEIGRQKLSNAEIQSRITRLEKDALAPFDTSLLPDLPNLK
jgi:hypothetical protein